MTIAVVSVYLNLILFQKKKVNDYSNTYDVGR